MLIYRLGSQPSSLLSHTNSGGKNGRSTYSADRLYRGMIDSQYKVPDNAVSTFKLNASILSLSFPSVTHFLCCIQVDDTPPLVSRSGRPIKLLPSGPTSLIGNNAPTLAAIMHRGVRLKKVTTKRMRTSPSVAATALAQAFKVNSQVLQLILIPFLYLLHLYS